MKQMDEYNEIENKKRPQSSATPGTFSIPVRKPYRHFVPRGHNGLLGYTNESMLLGKAKPIWGKQQKQEPAVVNKEIKVSNLEFIKRPQTSTTSLVRPKSTLLQSKKKESAPSIEDMLHKASAESLKDLKVEGIS